VRRSERIAVLTRLLTTHPAELVSLTSFSERFGVAKSTISEDIALIKKALHQQGLGHVETFAGAAGGVAFYPDVPRTEGLQLAREVCSILADSKRILSGGFLYMTDVVFSPTWSSRIGQFFASEFRAVKPEYVVTVETKGIPLALMTARCLNVAPVVLRRNATVTEGSSVSINYLSGSSQRIQTMSLARRAIPSGSRVLLVDDFMKGGGTARGMHEMMQEFQAEVVGLCLLVATVEPENKLVREYEALTILRQVDETAGSIDIRPADWLSSSSPE